MTTKVKPSFKIKKSVKVRYLSKEEVRPLAQETLKQYAVALQNLADR